MVEYGHGVSQGTGGLSGGGDPSGIDAGGNIGSMLGGVVNDAATTVSGLPPVVVALGAAVLVLLALMVLRRAI